MRANNVKQCPVNKESRSINAPLSDRPDRQHDNPPKPNRTRDDVGKKLGHCDRRRISANYPFPNELTSYDTFDFRRIRDMAS